MHQGLPGQKHSYALCPIESTPELHGRGSHYWPQQKKLCLKEVSSLAPEPNTGLLTANPVFILWHSSPSSHCLSLVPVLAPLPPFLSSLSSLISSVSKHHSKFETVWGSCTGAPCIEFHVITTIRVANQKSTWEHKGDSYRRVVPTCEPWVPRCAYTEPVWVAWRPSHMWAICSGLQMGGRVGLTVSLQFTCTYACLLLWFIKHKLVHI